jgi:poly-gamma-glutamate system protein
MKPATTQAGAAMTHVYWRPQRVGARALMLVTALAIVALAAVEFIPTRVEQRHYEDKLKAARLAQKAFGVLKTERQRLGIPIDAETDPGESGLVGALMSPVTTNSGHLPAKQTTLNPNWAAVFVGILKAAGLNAGDTVAIGVSGSFPAWNVATFAAVETLKLKPVVIASVSGSQFGANDPRFLWPDMEKLLFDRRVFTFRSVAASRGGLEDRALGLPKDSRALLDEAIKVFDASRVLVTNKQLSNLLHELQAKHTAPMVNHRPVKLYFGAQTGVSPPVFALKSNHPEQIPEAYARFLTRGIREAFGYVGTPIVLKFEDKHAGQER